MIQLHFLIRIYYYLKITLPITNNFIEKTIKGKDLNIFLLNKISDDLDNLMLPYKFDLSIYNYLQNLDIINHIEKIGVNFYMRLKRKS